LANLTVGSLFAGIGGFDLAAERAGLEVKWQVEIDDFCNRVLEKHWPHVRRYRDVRTVGPELERVDVICGGFPCQDISHAGKRAGIDGDRSGLWREMARLTGELRPRYLFVENVSALLGVALGRVLGDLAEIGYDAEWDCLPASAFGAPHRRDRIWIVAYPHRSGLAQRIVFGGDSRAHGSAPTRQVAGVGSAVSDADDEGQPGSAVDACARPGVPELGRRDEWWRTEPDVGRVADGVPKRVDRLRGLGNSIVPQVAEWIFRRIIDAERRGAKRPSQHGLSKPSNSEGVCSMKNPETTARVQEIPELADVESELREYAELVRDGIPFSLGVPTYERWADAIRASQARAAEAEGQLRAVDAVLARRPALDEPTRVGNILKAIRVASETEKLTYDLERARARAAALAQELREMKAQGSLGTAAGANTEQSAPRRSNEPTCEHGVAWDVHCCGCHSGFIFDSRKCVCF
jgi:DNA (cytosine-5)-methyltransferase 1